MASALQCPACGHKHRLSALTGDPIFSCEQCGRLLKTPVEYRRPEPSAPAEPPRPPSRPKSRSRSRVQRGGSAARDETSVLAAPPAESRAARAAAPKAARPRRARTPATLSLPLLVLGWVLALVIGGVIVRYVARFTGLLTGDSVIDLITGSGWGRYVRLFLVVPFWALVTAGLMTLFVEGGRRWQARQAAPAVRPATKRPSQVPTTRAPAPEPVPDPAPSPRAPAPAPTPAPTPTPAAAEARSPSSAAAAPRARRIPKRDVSS